MSGTAIYISVIIIVFGFIFWRIIISFKDISSKNIPKYRLVPDKDGTYNLEKYDPLVGYMCEAVKQTKESANECIKNLEREDIYYEKED